jgi:preprotein translocase subunit SecG
MLHSIVLVAHVFVALMIIGLVLLQRGKGAEAGTGFGAGASGTVFGARGSANFLSRATGLLATLFFITSLALAYLSTQRKAPASLLETPAAQQSIVPSAPPAVPAAGELPQLPSEGASDAPRTDAEEPPAGNAASEPRE